MEMRIKKMEIRKEGDYLEVDYIFYSCNVRI